MFSRRTCNRNTGSIDVTKVRKDIVNSKDEEPSSDETDSEDDDDEYNDDDDEENG